MPALSQSNQIEIWSDSPAFKEIEKSFAYPHTYKVSIALYKDKISIKCNESCWTAPLETSPR